jgi:hypothetical protein
MSTGQNSQVRSAVEGLVFRGCMMFTAYLPQHSQNPTRTNRSSGLIRNSYLLNKQMIIDNFQKKISGRGKHNVYFQQIQTPTKTRCCSVCCKHSDLFTKWIPDTDNRPLEDTGEMQHNTAAKISYNYMYHTNIKYTVWNLTQQVNTQS